MLNVLLFVSIAATTQPIIYKYVDQFAWRWDDSGSGASCDVSIWKPVDYQAGYYPLGDVAVATHSRPSSVALTVQAQEDDALAAPSSFTQIWKDSGSWADDDVRILQMNPPSGYTCLGHVAIEGYSSLPSTDEYRYMIMCILIELLLSFICSQYLYKCDSRDRCRCVKSEYVTTGSYEPIWNDKGSGASKDVGLFSNSEIGSVKAVYANTFTSVASHNQPSGSPYMLSSDNAILESLVTHSENENVAIKVYQGSDSDLIWKDRGSGGRYDISIYRPEGGKSVGDIAVNYYSSPKMTHTVNAVIEDALAAPVDFRKRWDDSGSGARWDVTFWEPICPSNYVPLGHVAVRNHHSKPSKNDVTCVKYDYVVTGNWQWVWNDRSTGSHDDVSVYQAVAKNSAGQGLQAMGTVKRHGSMDRTAYVLDSSIVQYVVGKPTTKYTLTNVNYLFDDQETLSNTPEELARTIVENQGTTEQTATRSISYTYEETHDWSREVGLEVAVEISVSAGIPDIASVSVCSVLV